MKKETKYILGIIITLVVIVGGISLLEKTDSKSTKYDSFAMCLSEKGAKFYGAFWCPHCQAQKKLFENSDKLPYVECSTPDANNQIQICKDLGIQSYPTWIFGDGTKQTGEMSFEDLVKKTGCELPTATQ